MTHRQPHARTGLVSSGPERALDAAWRMLRRRRLRREVLRLRAAVRLVNATGLVDIDDEVTAYDIADGIGVAVEFPPFCEANVQCFLIDRHGLLYEVPWDIWVGADEFVAQYPTRRQRAPFLVDLPATAGGGARTSFKQGLAECHALQAIMHPGPKLRRSARGRRQPVVGSRRPLSGGQEAWP